MPARAERRLVGEHVLSWKVHTNYLLQALRPVFVPQVGTTHWQACDKVILLDLNRSE